MKLPADHEPLVRDLWTLRLEYLQERAKRHAVDVGEDNSQVYSSQGDETDWTQATSDAESASASASASGAHETGYAKRIRQPEETPRLIESLALCYLAALLMRVPLTIGQLYKAVLREEVPFLRIIRHIPKEMRDKLPGEYHRSLDLKVRNYSM